jgi:NAD(P)H-dependent FMN reductase
MAGDVTLLLVSGSLRGGSTNAAVLATAADVAPAGVSTVIYDGLASLPHFNPDDDAEGIEVAAPVAAMREALGAADAVLVCTPEYAGALPGAFKNFLEWTIGNGGTYGKPVGWINAQGAGSPQGGALAHESLRHVLGYAGADVVEAACVRMPMSRDKVVDGRVADEALRDVIRGTMQALADHVRGAASAS